MAVTEAQKRATTRYEHNVYEKITVRIKTDKSKQFTGDITRKQISDAAEAAGESVNEYIINAVKMRMKGNIKNLAQDDLKVEKSVVSTPGYDPSLEPTREPAEDIP